MKKTNSGIMLTLLFIGTLALPFNVYLIEAESGATYPDDEGIDMPWFKESKTVRVLARRITVDGLEKLKQEVGVWKAGRNHNLIVDGHGTGLRPPTQKEWAKFIGEVYVVDEILWNNQMADPPSSVDHTNSSWFPPIGNQDGEGSCTAWAVGYYVKTFQEAKEHGWNLSVAVWEGGYIGQPTQAYQDRIFSPDFIYHQINGGGDNGSYFSDAINLVCSIGACSWEKMPYDPDNSTSWPSEEAWREAPLYRGNSTGIEYIILETNSDINDLKNWIASDHLAVIGVDATQYSNLTDEDVWTLDNYATLSINHANTIVGYDDNIEYTEEEELRYGAFKIANSWGEGGWENVDDGCYWISYEAMKQRVGYCMFYRDRIGYDPELVVLFKMDHSKRGECNITFGIGNKSTPIQTKRFDDWILNGGNHPFCSNNIMLDITEFKDTVPTVINQSFFMKVYDGGSPTTGTIESFSTEYYYNYSSGTLRAKSPSLDTPVNTTNLDQVFAELILDNIWIVDDDGPADFHTLQEAINAASDGDTIFVRAGTYFESVLVNKSVSLIGENKEVTVIDGHGKDKTVVVTANYTIIKGFTIQNTGEGIFLSDLKGSTICDVTVLSDSYGIYCYDVHDSIVVNTTVMNCYAASGVYLEVSQRNTIVGSIIDNNRGGIHIDFASNGNNVLNSTISNNEWGIIISTIAEFNTIVNNNIVSNDIGITLEYNRRNVIYHNSFINNSVQAETIQSVDNTWNDGYPSGGNYWSDLNPPDVYSGPYQNETGRDKIGDLPYIIDGNNTDRYPLIYPYGYVPTIDLNNDGVINIIDIVIVGLAFDTRPGDPKWNPIADLNQDGVVNIIDLVIIGVNFGKTS